MATTHTLLAKLLADNSCPEVPKVIAALAKPPFKVITLTQFACYFESKSDVATQFIPTLGDPWLKLVWNAR
jgi:hypothetical protein